MLMMKVQEEPSSHKDTRPLEAGKGKKQILPGAFRRNQTCLQLTEARESDSGLPISRELTCVV